MATAQCKQCGALRKLPHDKHELGQILKPYAGGGDYGHCLRCRRTATLMIIELPPPPKPILPVGWTKHPGENHED